MSCTQTLPAEVRALSNHILHGRSAVTRTLHTARFEPHEWIPQVHGRSVWVDADRVPDRIKCDMSPIFVASGTTALSADTRDDGGIFDANGRRVATHAFKTRLPQGVVQKRVRVPLVVGTYGELFCDERVHATSLRLVILNAPGVTGSESYKPLLELRDGDTHTYVPDHTWRLDRPAGVVAFHEGQAPVPHPPAATATYVLTAYTYVGRTAASDVSPTGALGGGATTAVITADDILDGVSNRFLTRDALEPLFSESIAGTTADDIADGSHNRYYDSALFDADLRRKTTDDVRPGVHNAYFTQAAFDAALATKTLEDVPETPTHRLFTPAALADVHNAPIGNAASIELAPQLELPSASERGRSALYVVREGNADVLYYKDDPIASGTGAAASSSSSSSAGGAASSSSTSPSVDFYAGEFSGETSGVHTGDVIGNVTGFVSRIDNHRVLSGVTVLGDVEGHVDGTLHGSVVGSFVGHVDATDGYMRNIYTCAIGAHDAADALLHVRGTSSPDGGVVHVKLSDETTGASASLSVDGDGFLTLESAQTRVQTLRCTGDAIFTADAEVRGDLRTQHAYTVGVTNSYYGIYEAGPIEGVTDLAVEQLAVSRSLSLGGAVYSDALSVAVISVATEAVRYASLQLQQEQEYLSVGTLHVSGLIECESLSAAILSLAATVVPSSWPGGGGGQTGGGTGGGEYDDEVVDLVAYGSQLITGDLFIGGALHVNGLSLGTAHFAEMTSEEITADVLSVGALTVGIVQGQGASAAFPFESIDGEFVGNAAIRGNLMVSGLVLTGTNNYLSNGTGHVDVDAALSVSGPINAAGSVDILAELSSLRAEVDALKARL